MTGTVDALLALRADVLATFPQWSGADVTLEPLSGGITNQNAVVNVSGPAPGRFVVHLPGERTELLGIDRSEQVEAATRAGALGVGPPVVGVLRNAGTPVTEFVTGIHLDGDAFIGRLGDVVALISRFHNSGALRSKFPIHRIVERHLADATAAGAAEPADFGRLRSVSQRIEEAFARSPDPPVPCHNDLLPGNVLFDAGRTWLIDFEYAGTNDRFFDLANLAVNCGLNDTGIESLLSIYLKRPVTDRDRARLSLMTIMSEFREGMWAVVQGVISTLDTDFGAYADEHLTNAVRLADTLDLGELTAAAAGTNPTTP